MAEKRRLDRLAQQLQVELGALIESEVDDPRVGMIAVTQVRVSPDMRHARVFISTMGETADRAKALEGLSSAKGLLRRQLSLRLPHLRRTPELTFAYDRSVENEMRVETLLTELHSDEQ